MTITMDRFVEILMDCYPSPQVIFDIGSMDGRDAAALKLAFPEANVHGFEAYEEEWKNASPQIDGWHNRLLWSSSGPLPFYPKGLGTGIHSARDRGKAYGKNVIILPAITMSDLCSSTGLPHPDVVKLDVEGCALDVLLGFRDLVHEMKVLHVETEETELFSGQALTPDVYSFLRNIGMELLEHDHCCLSQYDGVWIRR